LADLRRAGSRRGAGGDGCRDRRRRDLFRQLAHVRPGRARARRDPRRRAGSFREGREQIRRALGWYGGVVDLYQIHNLVGWREYLPYLEELRAAGTIRAIGITHYSASAFREMATMLARGR